MVAADSRHAWVGVPYQRDAVRAGYAVETIAGVPVAANYVTNITEAKRAAASVLARL